MAKETESVSWAMLPLISVLDPKSMRKAKLLLEEAAQLQEYIDMYEGRLKEILGCKVKDEDVPGELEMIQQAAGLPGLRFGGLCYKASTQPGRRSLDRGLLVENGVPPETIEASMKEGRPFVKREFKKIEV